MAQIPQSANIFSPSVARLAPSTAKDWNYVDRWLMSKFQGRPPPTFERNSETLNALVDLATLNEAADSDREILTNIESFALSENDNGNDHARSENASDTSAGPTARIAALIASIEANLPEEGNMALDTLAALAARLGVAYPTLDALGQKIVKLQSQFFQQQQAASRIEASGKCIAEEFAESQNLVNRLDESRYQPLENIAKLNFELQLKINSDTASLQEGIKQRANDRALIPVTIQQLQKDEGVYLELLACKRDLEGQINEFQGLSPDVELARQQLEDLRLELQSTKEKRDGIFADLIKQATPKKSSRKP